MRSNHPLKKTSKKLDKDVKTNHFKALENDQSQTTNEEMFSIEKLLLH